MAAPEEFDYVVVGAGTAGCVVAARLSESADCRVALIEAGGEDRGFWIDTPLGFGRLWDDPKVNWRYESEPEPELAGGKSYLPRGKVLGGTGTINAMVYVRGQRQDFERWRSLGNIGWGYDDVLPYYKRSEDNERGADAWHAVGGPMRVSDMPRHELTDAFIEAGVQAGYPRNPDFNGASQDGFGYNQVTIRDGRRGSTSIEFLRPAMRRANLKVLTHALATRILFEDRQARGVEFIRDGALVQVLARREVILCGGSFNSPQLLQVSGVGPATLLAQHGIPVVVDAPGVGANLQDHFQVSISYRCARPVTVNDYVNSPWRRLMMGAQYLLFRKGLMATNATMVGGCLRTDPTLPAPDVKVQLRLWGRSITGRSRERMGLHPFSSFLVSIMLLHPDNRGTVRIRSADSAVQPEIRFNYFQSERDRRASAVSLKAIRKVMSMPAIAPYVAEEMSPGPGCATDEELVAFCRRQGTTNHHSVGTCRMGVDEAAVVDPRLRVRGLRGLRVVDASIMPDIVGGNPNATVVMIAEKGSDMILEDGAS
jgi:choline dehydrogenase